jgi:uncharacterized protein YraI
MTTENSNPQSQNNDQDNQSAQTNNQQAPQTTTSSSKSNTWLIVITVIIGAAIIIGLGILVGMMLGGSEKSAQPTVALTPPPDNVPLAYANDYVNVRSGPSTDYPSFGVAAPGKSAEIIGISPDNSWWAIKIPQSISTDGIGWVSANYVTTYNTNGIPVIQPPPLPPDVGITPPPPEDASCTTIEPVNIRSGPGNMYESYGKAPIGVTGKVIGVSPDNGWWVVELPTNIAPDGQGWVKVAYCPGTNTNNVPVIQPPASP